MPGSTVMSSARARPARPPRAPRKRRLPWQRRRDRRPRRTGDLARLSAASFSAWRGTLDLDAAVVGGMLARAVALRQHGRDRAVADEVARGVERRLRRRGQPRRPRPARGRRSVEAARHSRRPRRAPAPWRNRAPRQSALSPRRVTTCLARPWCPLDIDRARPASPAVLQRTAHASQVAAELHDHGGVGVRRGAAPARPRRAFRAGRSSRRRPR